MFYTFIVLIILSIPIKLIDNIIYSYQIDKENASKK